MSIRTQEPPAASRPSSSSSSSSSCKPLAISKMQYFTQTTVPTRIPTLKSSPAPQTTTSLLPIAPPPPPSSSASASSSSSTRLARSTFSSPKFSSHQASSSLFKLNCNFAFLALVTVLLFLLLICIENVTSLSCYTCSSYDNPLCDESFSIGANLTGTDCDRDGRPGKVCRKLVQYIEHKKVVIRECGYLNEHETTDPETKERKAMCYKRSGTFALMMESCICYGDNCNHSASLVPNQQLLITMLMLVGGCALLIGRRLREEGCSRLYEVY